MATDTPGAEKADRHDAGKRKDAKGGAPKGPSSKAKGKHAEPGKAGKSAAGKRGQKNAGVTAIDRVKAAAGAVVNAATTPRGAAIGAAAATVGLIAGLVAMIGPRRIGKATSDATTAVTDRLPHIGGSEPAERSAETIGAIMAKAAANGDGAV
ncbi:hypothetical protein [Sphingomonas montana]|uniref:hypothetical protein n=1 Tax=Sphingomonas montana TaxID=1843236 RepID=UPI00096DC838|nr:hypothetical protein [Sphingomonas montana]